MQTFVEPIATLPYGTLFSPQKSSQPPVDSNEADPRPAAEYDEFFQAPDAQSKEEAINKFWMAWRVGNAVDSRTFTDFLTICSIRRSHQVL